MVDTYIKLLAEGYPKEIIGNDGYRATLCGVQILNPNDHVGIYRYPGGECCHSLEEAVHYAEKHNEVCIELLNHREVDGYDIAYVALRFEGRTELTQDNYDCMIDISLYDNDKNEVLFEKYEMHSFTNVWTIEKAIDSSLIFAIGDCDVSYKIVSHDIEDFEQENEVDR